MRISTTTIPNAPPMPGLLRYSLTLARLLPGLTLLALAAALAVSPDASPLLTWMRASYGVTREQYALFAAVFGLLSLVWVMGYHLSRRAPTLDVLGMVVLSAPLLLYIALVVWYALVVTPERNKSGAALLVMFYLTMVALYAVRAGVRLWELAWTRRGEP